jgi:L-iditol 2-dehydrogenase
MMKALVKTAVGEGAFGLQYIPEPVPASDEVLLKIGAAGICGSDLHILAGEYPCNPPVVLGHEFNGTIISLGKNVSGWAVGDRVVSMPYAVVCGACQYCQAGEYGLCTSRLSYGSGVNGGFAEYLAVKASRIFRLPDSLGTTAAALIEPLACSVKAVYDVAGLQPGETAIVIGPGPVGLLTLQAACAAGARVTLVGLNCDAERLSLGKDLGAEEIVFSDEPDSAAYKRMTGNGGGDAVFECSGASAALRMAFDCCKKKGRVIQVGLFGRAVEINPDPMVMKDLTVKGTFASSRNSWELSMQLVRSQKIRLSEIVSDVYPFEEWEEAFTQANSRSRLKVVFQPPQ